MYYKKLLKIPVFVLVFVFAHSSSMLADTASTDKNVAQDKMTVAVLMSTVREKRQGPVIANQVVKQLKAKDLNVILIDPAVYQLPMLDKRLIDYPKGEVPEKVMELATLLGKADGYVFVSAIYNGGVPPALKNLLDHFHRNRFERKPVAIVTYSASRYGGVQVVDQLRSIVPVFQAITIPRSVSVPNVRGADTSQYMNAGTISNLDRMIDQLKWYAKALKQQRIKN